MIADEDYCELLTHQPAKPRNRQELEEMVSLLENLGMNETRHSPATERFIETVTTLVIQYEEEIEPGPEPSPAGVLRFLMEEHKLLQVDLVPILGSK